MHVVSDLTLRVESLHHCRLEPAATGTLANDQDFDFDSCCNCEGSSLAQSRGSKLVCVTECACVIVEGLHEKSSPPPELRLKQSRIQSWILLRMRTELCNAIYSPLYTPTYITLTSAPTDSPKKSIET
jgi:hypothetical protein